MVVEIIRTKDKQAGAELGQAQVRLDDILEVVIEVGKYYLISDQLPIFR